MRSIPVLSAALIIAAAVVLHASDPTAVYARVDRVVLEPSADAPQRIQVWGVFSLAKPNDRNEYLPPARGYLYFTLPANSRMALAEWSDLKSLAGTGQIVAFGSRYEMHARVRNADERPDAPDAYSLNIGLRKERADSEYAPVRALVNFKP